MVERAGNEANIQYKDRAMVSSAYIAMVSSAYIDSMSQHTMLTTT